MKIIGRLNVMLELYVLVAIFGAASLGVSQVFLKKGVKEVTWLGASWGGIRKTLGRLLNRYFFVAIILGTFGGIGNLIALSMGEITIVQPLMSFATLVAILMSVVWLKESLSGLEYLEVGLIFVGIIFLNMAA